MLSTTTKTTFHKMSKYHNTVHSAAVQLVHSSAVGPLVPPSGIIPLSSLAATLLNAAHSAQCCVHIAQSANHTAHSTSALSTQHTAHSTQTTAHRTQHTEHSTQNTEHRTLNTEQYGYEDSALRPANTCEPYMLLQHIL